MCILYTLLEVERISSFHMIHLGPYIATIATRVLSIDNRIKMKALFILISRGGACNHANSYIDSYYLITQQVPKTIKVSCTDMLKSILHHSLEK